MIKNISVFLPSKLIDAVDVLETTKKQKHYMLKILSILFDDLCRKDVFWDEYSDYPTNYWKKAICEHYERLMNQLIDNDIVDRVNSYSTYFNQCKKYRIQPSLIEGDPVKVNYTDYSASEKQNSFECKQTRKTCYSLKIDRRKATRYVIEYINSDTIERSLKFNDKITQEGLVQVLYKESDQTTYFRKYMLLSNALEFAKKLNKDLIQDKRKFIIGDKEKYIEDKKRKTKYSYLNCIHKISERRYYANRNNTNNRLDSIVTNLPSALLQFIKLDGGNLVSFDLANSQFLILALLIEKGMFEKYINESKTNCGEKSISINMKKDLNIKEEDIVYKDKIRKEEVSKKEEEYVETVVERRGIDLPTYMCAKTANLCTLLSSETPVITGDLALFIELAKNGKFYDYLQEKLGYPAGHKGRSAVKGLMFLIFFSKHRFNCPEKAAVKAIFPTLVEMIDLFKKEKRAERKAELEAMGLPDDKKGDNQFAIMLQKKESEIFIDGILNDLFKQSFKVLSKHDSILCKGSDLEAVRAFIIQYLETTFGKGNFTLKMEIHAPDDDLEEALVRA